MNVTYPIRTQWTRTPGVRFAIHSPDVPVRYTIAYNAFQRTHKILGLTVFRRWLRIFHPGVEIIVYTR